MKFRTVVEKRGYLWVLPLLLPLLHHSPFRRSPPWNNTVETNSFRSFCARLLHPRVRASKHLKTTRSNVTHRTNRYDAVRYISKYYTVSNGPAAYIYIYKHGKSDSRFLTSIAASNWNVSCIDKPLNLNTRGYSVKDQTNWQMDTFEQTLRCSTSCVTIVKGLLPFHVLLLTKCIWITDRLKWVCCSFLYNKTNVQLQTINIKYRDLLLNGDNQSNLKQ